MNTVTLSPKFQVVIPLEIRKSLQLKAGQKMQVFESQGHIVIVPLRPIQDMRGAFKGIDTNIQREPDR